MKKIFLYTSACIVGFFVCTSLAHIVEAQTFIQADRLDYDTVWTASSSPYVLRDNLRIPSGVHLEVEPGVEIRGDGSQEFPPSLIVNGSLSLKGNSSKPIQVSRLWDITVEQGSAEIIHTHFTHMEQGIHAVGAAVSVDQSRFEHNTLGLFAEPYAPVFPAFKPDPYQAIGGIGNAFQGVTVTNSAFVDNTEAGIKNSDADETVIAPHNWWGNSAGPLAAGANTVLGPIEYNPWLDHDPQATTTPCCSSIVFLPGLEGSRIYRTEKTVGITRTNTLWEPNRNADVKKLYLNSQGSSTDSLIYSGGPIDKALGVVDIYDTFMDFLDGLASQGTINEWKAFGYDWRKPITEVVAGAEKRATTTEALISTIEHVASRSKTGKVNIIAHSNGGLVAKYLVKVLADMGKADLIDTVVSVAVPYLGTPEAIGALLHGDHQALLGGLIETAATGRGLGANMASAYSLLPSKEYFSRIIGPSIAFASTSVTGIHNNQYPKNITTYDDQMAFIADTQHARPDPQFSDTDKPIRGNQALITAARTLHTVLDQYSWPTNVQHYAILGWNMLTTKTLSYKDKYSCRGVWIGFACSKIPIHMASTTHMGDGTVMAPSAAFGAGTSISLDLEAESQRQHANISHANILEGSTMQAAVNAIVTKPKSSSDEELKQNLARLPGVTLGEPDYSKESSYFVVSTHSPVDLHVYDNQGNHTGIVPLPPELDDEDSFYTGMYENKIIGSKFEVRSQNEEGTDSYVYVPDKPGQTYTVVIEGNDVGTFTYDVERRLGDQTLETVEFRDIPVTPLTVATSSINARPLPGVVPPSLASSTAPLAIDVDGNGSVDIVADSRNEYDPIIFLESLKKTVIAVAGNIPRGKAIVKQIDKIEDLIKKGKLKQATKVAERMQRRIRHIRSSKITDANRNMLLDMIETFLSPYAGQ